MATFIAVSSQMCTWAQQMGHDPNVGKTFTKFKFHSATIRLKRKLIGLKLMCVSLQTTNNNTLTSVLNE